MRAAAHLGTRGTTLRNVPPWRPLPTMENEPRVKVHRRPVGPRREGLWAAGRPTFVAVPLPTASIL
jgi:hypothetical protein